MELNLARKILNKVISDKINWIRYQDGQYTIFRNAVSPSRIIYLSLNNVMFVENEKEDLILKGDFSKELEIVGFKEKINLKDWP